ncbi:MAG: dihydropteroate synthase [Kiritimatiellae bacterium]|nr:dihydropteroate synthase [Kiritimatiellia bacterium]
MACKVMGIVNVTPDSFSDGGKFNTPEEAIRRAKNLIEEGAAIIDIGGESTRPGATPLKWDEEWARVEPVLRGLSPQLKGSVPISIDTYHPETAERAIALGASIVNCVFKEPIRDMAAICVKNNAELVIPCRIADLPLGSVPMDAGRLYLDPMIGFGTTREEDLEILRSISELAKRGRVLVGASRKRIVKRLTGEKAHGKDLAGNLAIAVWAAISGASVVRVHDVRETVQALKVTAALTGADEAN